MQNSGILQLLAELALGVLGFSGVVAVLGRRSEGEWTPVDRVRFFGMVRVTALVLVLAVLPFPFYSASFASEAIWAWCSAIAVVICVLVQVGAQISERAPKGIFTAPGTSRLATAYAGLAYLGSLLLFGMNATGIGLERSATPYLVALLLIFGIPVVLFIRLLHSALGPERAA
jgi:hypothetical protein